MRKVPTRRRNAGAWRIPRPFLQCYNFMEKTERRRFSRRLRIRGEKVNGNMASKVHKISTTALHQDNFILKKNLKRLVKEINWQGDLLVKAEAIIKDFGGHLPDCYKNSKNFTAICDCGYDDAQADYKALKDSFSLIAGEKR